MSTPTTTLSWHYRITRYLRDIIQYGLIRYLPQRIKRMIYLASIAGFILEQRADRTLTTRINRVLGLAKDPKALEFPIAVRYFIWRDLAPGAVFSSEMHDAVDTITPPLKNIEGIDACIAFFHNNAPPYLLYDTPERVKNDLIALFNSLEANAG